MLPVLRNQRLKLRFVSDLCFFHIEYRRWVIGDFGQSLLRIFSPNQSTSINTTQNMKCCKPVMSLENKNILKYYENTIKLFLYACTYSWREVAETASIERNGPYRWQDKILFFPSCLYTFEILLQCVCVYIYIPGFS